MAEEQQQPAAGRSLSRQEREHAEKLQSITELFPDMSREVVDTILFNNRGQVDATINALLGMSDPAYRPDAADQAKQEVLARDEAYARRLAASDLRAARQSPAQPRRPRANSAASEGAAKKPSRIRDIFRRKKNAASEPPDATAAAAARRDQDRYIRPRHELDSDFSDGRRSPSSGGSSGTGSGRSSLSGRAVARNAAPAAHAVDLLGEDANSTLAAYAPLSPSKHVPRSPVSPAQPSSPVAQPSSPASPAARPGEPYIDLDNPFDDNPLLHDAAAPTNPFAAPLPDSNPFRGRR
ncbi:hypothetical protein IWQ56_000301 [Coemansia nantahalensis]|nr:hypothetical protein IWQ56_000301 [Coemansia nantahalensis]